MVNKLFDDAVFPSADELAKMLGIEAVSVSEVHDAITESLEAATNRSDDSNVVCRDGMDRSRGRRS